MRQTLEMKYHKIRQNHRATEHIRSSFQGHWGEPVETRHCGAASVFSICILPPEWRKLQPGQEWKVNRSKIQMSLYSLLTKCQVLQVLDVARTERGPIRMRLNHETGRFGDGLALHLPPPRTTSLCRDPCVLHCGWARRRWETPRAILSLTAVSLSQLTVTIF
jgi:hypothetical protein